MSTPPTTEKPGAQKRPWWKTSKGIAGIVAVLLIFGLVNSCNNAADDETTPASGDTTQTTAVETTTAAPDATTPEEETMSEDQSADQEAWLKERFGVSSFTEVLMQDSTLWAGYVNGVEADGDRMHVRLQVDRTSHEGKDLGERAAKAIASFIRMGDDPRVSDVSWVVVEDGAGTYISQEKV